MGLFDSLFGGSSGGKAKVDDWSKAVAGVGLSGLGSTYFEGWRPNYARKDLQYNQKLISEDNLIPYDMYGGQRFANNPEELGMAQDYIMGARNPNEAGIGRAMQLYNRGANFDPSRIQDYENQYTSGIIDEIYRIGSERLTEDLLPGVNSTFTGAGQFGSSRHEEFTNRALRDTQREALGQTRQVLFDSRDNAMDQYAAERGRDLQAGRGFSELPGQAGVADTNYINNLLRTGELSRIYDQQGLDFDYEQWMRQENQMQDFINQWTGQSAAAPRANVVQEGSSGGILGALGGLAAAAGGAYGMFGS